MAELRQVSEQGWLKGQVSLARVLLCKPLQLSKEIGYTGNYYHYTLLAWGNNQSTYRLLEFMRVTSSIEGSSPVFL